VVEVVQVVLVKEEPVVVEVVNLDHHLLNLEQMELQIPVVEQVVIEQLQALVKQVVLV
jgi:hypothetical protein